MCGDTAVVDAPPNQPAHDEMNEVKKLTVPSFHEAGASTPTICAGTVRGPVPGVSRGASHTGYVDIVLQQCRRRHPPEDELTISLPQQRNKPIVVVRLATLADSLSVASLWDDGSLALDRPSRQRPVEYCTSTHSAGRRRP